MNLLNFVKNILKFSNRINIFLINVIFNQKKRYKIKWYKYDKNSNDTIFNLIEEFYSNQKKIKNNINNYYILGLYIVLNIFINIFLMIIKIFLNYQIQPKNKIVSKLIIYKPFKTEYLNDYLNELKNFNIGNEPIINNYQNKIHPKLKKSINFKKCNGIYIYIDNYTEKYDNNLINNFAKNSLNFLNGGGSSEISEMLSIHILFNSKLKPIDCKFEKTIKYIIPCKIIDYLLIIKDNQYNVFKIGVSVTRCFNHFENFITDDDIKKLLIKKINGIVLARQSIDTIDIFNDFILHIFVKNENIKNIIIEVFKTLNLKELYIIGNLSLWITITQQKYIFTNSIEYN